MAEDRKVILEDISGDLMDGGLAENDAYPGSVLEEIVGCGRARPVSTLSCGVSIDASSMVQGKTSITTASASLSMRVRRLRPRGQRWTRRLISW